MINFDDWCYHAVAQIRFRPDREAVFQELKAHMQDHYEDLISQGYTAEKARQVTLRAMGDPEEIAPQLGAIHKPWLGYIYRIVKWVTIPACAWAIFLLIAFCGSHIHSLLSTANYPALQEKGEGGIWLQPAVSDESDGYRFKVTEAAVNAQGDTLYLELQIIYLPWMPKPGIVNYFWAVDSLGNHYDCRKDFMYDDVPRVAYQGGFYSQGFESNQLEVQHFDSGAQWLELHYDRDGRDIVLRIDLTGGEEK